MNFRTIALATAALTVPAIAQAGGGTVSGSSNGLSWTATSNIIGGTSTATQAPPTPPGTVGNPIYWGHSPAPGFNNSKYSGVGAIILNEGAAGNFICSGSLLSDRIHVLTAGHCVSNGNGSITPIAATVAFYGGTDPEAVVGTVGTPSVGVVRINVASFSVNPLYTGEVIDDHDVAVITLAQAAPSFVTGYDLDYYTDLTSVGYNIAGYGQRSDQGGAIGANLGTGRLRQGDNRYDFRFGDPAFQHFFDGGPDGFFGEAETKYSWVSDFDNGLAANDASCKLATLAFGVGGPQFCNLGGGASEVSSAGGDSGGPQFVNGKITSVTSYGLSFGSTFGDYKAGLNSSWGEFNGFAPVRQSWNYLNLVLGVPEPATWALMIGGFGMVGTSLRRQRKALTA